MLRRRFTRLSALAATLVLHPGGAAAADTARLVPIVLDVASGPARYTTELALTNRGATTVAATLRYHPSLGATAGGETTRSIAAGRQLVLPDVIAALRESGLALPEGEAHAGTLEVVFAGAESDDVVAATARTTTAVTGPDGRAGLAYGGLRGGSTTALTVYGLRESATDRSNLALLSTSSEPVTLKVTVRSGSGDGASAVVRETETLPPFGWLQIGRVLQGTGIASGWAEIERVGGSGTFSAYGVVNDNVTNDGSFLPPVADGRSGDRLTVPVVAEASNLGSELVLANRGASPVTLTLSYVRSVTAPDGGDGTTTVTLAAREQRIVPDAIDLLRRSGVPVGEVGATHVGSLRITLGGAPLDRVFAAARTGFRSGGGSFGLFTPAVSPGEEATTDVALYGLSADAANRTNVAVVHSGPDGSGPITLEIRAYDGDAAGAERGSPIRQALQPGQHAQVNLILGAAGIRNGWVRVRRLSGTAPWLAYGVVNDGGVPGERTGDGSYVSMEVPFPAPAPPGTIGPAGGTVSLADGSASLIVPPGSLAAPIALTLTRRAGAPLDPNLDASSLVDVAPADARFTFPATLTLRYDPVRTPSGLAEERLGVHRLAGAAWEPAASPHVDAAANEASGDVSSGGTFGVRRRPSAAPCALPQDRQLDFWLGTWAYSANGVPPGTNDVTRDAEGCVVEESLSLDGGYRGRSINLYDPSTALWHQTYVDSEGARMILRGTFTGDRMLLYETSARRHSWRALDANRVRLALEESTNGGTSWVERFNALYTRK